MTIAQELLRRYEAGAAGEPAEDPFLPRRGTGCSSRTCDGRSRSTAYRREPVLLVDDVVESPWTLTVAGAPLLEAGSGPVSPFVLAKASATS